MLKCTAAEAVILPSGVVALDDNQARRRAHLLKKTKGGFEIVKPIQFKAGEKFGYEGPMDRTLAAVLGVSEKAAEKMNAAHAKAQAALKNGKPNSKAKPKTDAADGEGDEATGDGDDTNTGSDEESGDGEGDEATGDGDDTNTGSDEESGDGEDSAAE